MRFKQQLAVLAMVAFCSIGCDTPYFSYPLAEETEETRDISLYGSWLLVEDGRYDKAGYVHIGKNKETGRTTLVITSVSAEDRVVETTNCTAHATVLNTIKYLSVQCDNFDGHPKSQPSFFVIQYEIKKDTATFRSINHDAFIAAIKGGTLRGEVEDGRFGPSVEVTDSSENVQRFITDNKDIVYEELAVLYRINPVKAIIGPPPKPPKKCTSVRKVE